MTHSKISHRKFNLNPSPHSLEEKKRLHQQKTDLENRIDRLSHDLNTSQPVDQFMVFVIQQFSKQPNDLALMAKALERIASLIPALNEVNKKIELMEAIEKQSDWITSVYGDFHDFVNDLSPANFSE